MKELVWLVRQISPGRHGAISARDHYTDTSKVGVSHEKVTLPHKAIVSEPCRDIALCEVEVELACQDAMKMGFTYNVVVTGALTIVAQLDSHNEATGGCECRRHSSIP